MTQEQKPTSPGKKPEIEGLTPELIHNLKDIAQKWGHLERQSKSFHYSSGNIGLAYRLLVTVIPSGKDAVFVSKDPDVNKFTRFETNSGVIFWDSTLTVQEAQKAIERIDNDNKKLIAPKTGKRKPKDQSKIRR